MIKITLLNGPYENQTRAVSLVDDPMALLQACVNHDWDWKLDYLEATDEEAFCFGRADIAVRCVRALHQGRFVRFFDSEFRFKEGDDRTKIIQELEDHIVNSGYNIYISADNEDGVIIGTAGPERR